MVDTPASKAGARLGVRVRVSRLVLGEAKRFNTSARVRVLWPTLGRVALWLVPLRGVFSCGGWCVGSYCALRVLDGCFVSLFLDSNPARSLGPPAKRFAHIVWVGFDSSAVRWGPCSCLLGLPRLCSGGRGVGFSLFLVWTVFAWLSRRVGGCSLWGCSGISRLSTVWPLPVLSRAGRERAVPCWGWCGFRAWRCRGVGDDGIPRDCTRCGCSCGVSLYSSARCCSPGAAHVCLSVRALFVRVLSCALFRVGCFATLVAVCPCGCLFVGCSLWWRALLVCGGLCCLSAIVWCAFRECSRSYCDVVHSGWCGCTFDGDLGCRLLFTV